MVPLSLGPKTLLPTTPYLSPTPQSHAPPPNTPPPPPNPQIPHPFPFGLSNHVLTHQAAVLGHVSCEHAQQEAVQTIRLTGQAISAHPYLRST